MALVTLSENCILAGANSKKQNRNPPNKRIKHRFYNMPLQLNLSIGQMTKADSGVTDIMVIKPLD